MGIKTRYFLLAPISIEIEKHDELTANGEPEVLVSWLIWPGGVGCPAGDDPVVVLRPDDVEEGAGGLEAPVVGALVDHLGGSLQPRAVVPPLNGGCRPG